MATASAAKSDFLLLVRDTTPEVYDAMSPEQRRASLDRWNGWVDEMAAKARLKSAAPLASAARIVSGAGGRRVFDGPFTEAKEMVGGFFLLSSLTLDEVTEIASSCPNLENGMTVEIRPVAGVCHLAESLGWEQMRQPAIA